MSTPRRGTYGGTAEANETRAVRLALADHLAGRRVFTLAGTNERAARVAGRFRDGLVAYKRVEAEGVRLSDGNLAGVGDRIVTRVNERTMTTSRGRFVTNRSVYQVLSRHRDGALTVGVVDPATGFVADNVILPRRRRSCNLGVERTAASPSLRLSRNTAVGEEQMARPPHARWSLCGSLAARATDRASARKHRR